MPPSIDIAIIGFGEVGRIFAHDLSRNGARVAAYDLTFDGQDGIGRRQAAHGTGVRAGRNAADACSGAHLVISAVTADAAESVARDAASFLRPGQIYLDINSAAPSTKRRSADAMAPSGACFVEGAVMASVPGPRIAVPILGGGREARRAADLLNPLGMSITPVSDEVGRASATKLCRSIMIKGIEALILDCAAAAERWGVSDDVFASLGATFPSIDWAKLAVDMAKRVQDHGIRRAAEMREAAQMLTEIGRDPVLSLAVADRQEAGARPRAPAASA